MTFRRGLASAAALAVLLSAGSVFAAEETIAVFTKNQTNPFFEVLRVGAQKAAQALGAKIINYIPTQPDSIPEQLSEIDDVIVKKPDAILLIPVDYKAMVPGIQRINAAKIPIVNLTDRSAGGDFVAFVGADDYGIAQATAERLLQEIGGKGKVIILEGVRGSLTASDRLRGFQDALKKFPGVKLVASQPGNYQRLVAMQVMENLLQRNPDVNGVLAANDAMAIGALDALNEADAKALVVGINGTKEAVDAIKSGKLLATGDYNGFLQGCIATTIAIRSLRGEPVPKDVTLKPIVIDRTNYEPYDVAVKDRTCPAWDQEAAQ